MIWITKFRLTDENREELLDICKELKVTDATFNYTVNTLTQSVYIKSKSKKQSFRRGMWIKKRLASHAMRSHFRNYKES